MTIPEERVWAVLETGRFLRRLMYGMPKVPRHLRETAVWLERHYPSAADLFMAAHGYRTFAAPDDGMNPLRVPPPVDGPSRTELSGAQFDELVEIVERMPVSSGFDRRQWLDGWLDMPHPALRGATPRDVAGRSGGYEIVRRVLLAVLDSSFV